MFEHLCWGAFSEPFELYGCDAGQRLLTGKRCSSSGSSRTELWVPGTAVWDQTSDVTRARASFIRARVYKHDRGAVRTTAHIKINTKTEKNVVLLRTDHWNGSSMAVTPVLQSSAPTRTCWEFPDDPSERDFLDQVCLFRVGAERCRAVALQERSLRRLFYGFTAKTRLVLV